MQAGTARWVRSGFVVVACLAGVSQVLCGCLTALFENPDPGCSNELGLPDGAPVPDEAIAPLLGDHIATLTWTLPNRTTTLHLDIERTASDVALRSGCDQRVSAFVVKVSAHLVSDDGIWNQQQSGVLSIDPAGQVMDPIWTWETAAGHLRDAGDAPDWASDSYAVSVTIPIVKLRLADGTIQITNPLHSTAPLTIGTIQFSR
jgi:hypothetical protein